MLSMLPPRPSRAFTTPLPGLAGSIGVPEASSGMPSPPQSPPLAARNTSATKQSISDVSKPSGRARRGGAAYHITEECERLFCETLRTVFLGEGNLARQDSLVTGMQDHVSGTNDYGIDIPLALDGYIERRGLVYDWIETFDYVGGNRFRGFVTEKDNEKAMFVFFDQSVIGGDLKSGLMALLELCDVTHFTCSRLVVCIDRHTDSRAMDAITKDLGWIGFQLTTLDDWTSGDEITSEQWLFMDMDV